MTYVFFLGVLDVRVLTAIVEQKVKIKNLANGKTATATVRDACPGCGANDIGTCAQLVL